MASRRPEDGLTEAAEGAAIAMLERKQREPDQRNDDVHVEDNAGIAGREISFRHHLVDVSHRGAEKKQRRSQDRRQPQVEAAECGRESHGRKAQARHADLELERAVGPTDEGRRHLPEEDMKDEIAEVSHAEGEKDVMAARMKSAMAIDAYCRETGLTTSLPCVPNCQASWRSSSHE